MSALNSLLPFGDQNTTVNDQPVPQSPVSALDSLMPLSPPLPAAASDAAGVPPSPEEALPVDPVVPVASGGRNNARVAPEPPAVADEPFDAAMPDESVSPPPVAPPAAVSGGRNDTSRFNTLAPPELGEDGVNPVSVFNPAPLTQDQIREIELSRVKNVMAQPGPTTDKANLNINPTISGVQGVPGNFTMEVMGIRGPTDDETAAQAIAYGNTYKIPNNAFMRGLSRANQSMALLGANLGLIDQSEAIKVITELNRITPDQPPELQAALQEIVNADGWLESLQAIANNPGAVMSVVAESLPMSAASLGVFLTGSAVGTPLTGSALAGLVTYGQIYNDVILSELREAGVDMNNNAAVQQMLSDPEFYARARDRAGTYALPIAVFDALSMGLAGKIAGAAIKSGAPTSRIAAAAGTDTFLQMGFGSAGEATAQLLELEKGFRDKISKGEIVLEGVAEGPIGAIEVAAGTASGARQARDVRLAREQQLLEEQVARNIAIQLQSSDNAQMTLVPDGALQSLMPDVDPAPVSAAIPATEPVSPAASVPAADPTPEPVAAPVQAPEPEKTEPDLMAPVEPEPKPQPEPQISTEPEPQPEPEAEPDPATVLARLAAEPDPAPETEFDQAIIDEAQTILPGKDEESRARTEKIRGDNPKSFFAGRVLKWMQGNQNSSTTIQSHRRIDGTYKPEFEAEHIAAFEYLEQQGLIEKKGRGYIVTNKGLELRKAAETPEPPRSYERQITEAAAPLIDSVNERLAKGENLVPARVEFEIQQDPALQDLPLEVRDEIKRRAYFYTDAAVTVDRALKELPGVTIKETPDKMGLVFEFTLEPTKEQMKAEPFLLQEENGLQPVYRIGITQQDTTNPEMEVRFNLAMGRTIGDGLNTENNVRVFKATESDPRIARLEKKIAAFNKDNRVQTQLGRKKGYLRKALDESKTNFLVATSAKFNNFPNVKTRVKTDKEDGWQTIEGTITVPAEVAAANPVLQKKNGEPMSFKIRVNKAFGEYKVFAASDSSPLLKKFEAFRKVDDTFSKLETALQEELDKKPAFLDPDRQAEARMTPKETPRTSSYRDVADAPQRSADTGTAEALSEETAAVGEDRVVRLSDLDVDNQRTQKPGTLVNKMSLRRRTALQMQAFADAGLDPNTATNLPIERQFEILRNLVKERFGFKTVAKTKKANAKDAVDQLLTAYHNLNDMAVHLGLPQTAMGLNGTLSFVMSNSIGAYGVYQPGLQAITLPEKSNSFMHEWFHALDHYLFEQYGNKEKPSNMPLASQQVKDKGGAAFDGAPANVEEAYFALMRALFRDKATEAAALKRVDAEITAVKARAEKAGRDVTEQKNYKELVAKRDRILQGNTKMPSIGKTQMRKDAEFFAAITQSDANYWASPYEMAARAFEAFSVTQVTNAGLQADFLGKDREGYDMTLEQLGVTREGLLEPENMLRVLDSRLALTFPKDSERVEIFGAFRNLMDALAVETALGEGTIRSETGQDFVLDVRDFHNVPEPESKGFIADQKAAHRRAKNFADRMQDRADQYGGKHKGVKSFYVAVEDLVFSPLFYQKQGALKALIKRYPNNDALQYIFKNLASQTGGELQSTREGGTMSDAQARQTRIFADRMKSALDKHEYAEFSVEEVQQLRDILISEEPLDTTERVKQLAGDMRLIYNGMYEYNRNAGLDIGYAPNGYVPRMLDLAEVYADLDGFLTQSRQVYEVVWDNEVGTYGDVADIDADFVVQTVQFIQKARVSIEEYVPNTTDRKSLGNSRQYTSFTGSEAYKSFRTAYSKLDALKKDPTAKPKDIADAEQKLEDALDQIRSRFDTFFADMRNLYGEYRGKNWRQSITNSNNSVSSSSPDAPQNSFTKKRQLPPEADKLMEQFYISDPAEALTNYILSSVRKAEYNRRFGKQLLPPVAKKTNYADYLDYLIATATDEKTSDPLSKAERDILKSTVSDILGRGDYEPSGVGQKLVNRTAALMSMTLLIRAPIAGIAEPFTTALTTGKPSAGLNAFALTLQEFPGLRKLSANAKEDIRLRHQFARIMGVIDDPDVGDIIMNRIGGEFQGDQKLQRQLASFFQKIKLTGMTNAQRRSAARIGFQFLTELAYEVRNPSSDRNLERAKLTLKDLGVAESRMEQFVDYVLSFNDVGKKGKVKGKIQLPEVTEVMDQAGDYNDMGLQLAVSIMRFTDQTIQDPRVADRPKWAERGVGRLVYGITSFIYSFQDKVLKAMGRKVKREFGISRRLGASKKRATFDAGMYATTSVGAPLLTLFTAHALVSTAREFIFNQDRWDREWEESDQDFVKFMANYLFPLAFARAGMTGAFDPLFQAFTGLKYQRDLSNALIGTAGYITQNFEDMAGLFINNSPNTVSAEFKAARGLWNLTVQPAISLAIAMTPMSSTTALIGAGGGMAATSTTLKNYMINNMLELFYGQRYEPGQRGRPKSGEFKF